MRENGEGGELEALLEPNNISNNISTSKDINVVVIDESKLKSWYKNLIKTSISFNKTPIDYFDLKEILQNSINSGFKGWLANKIDRAGGK
jgi:hypothetical protein